MGIDGQEARESRRAAMSTLGAKQNSVPKLSERFSTAVDEQTFQEQPAAWYRHLDLRLSPRQSGQPGAMNLWRGIRFTIPTFRSGATDWAISSTAFHWRTPCQKISCGVDRCSRLSPMVADGSTENDGLATGAWRSASPLRIPYRQLSRPTTPNFSGHPNTRSDIHRLAVYGISVFR